MSTRFLIYLAGGLLGVGATGFAEPTRVTTWNLEISGDAAAGSGTNEARLQAAAAALGKMNPDVILLQQVQDWQTCARLVQELKPANYNILVCSAFPPSSSSKKQTQLAILSKQKAYFSWSEPWRGESGASVPGGFAFAAITVGDRRIGLFSVLFDNTMRPDGSTEGLPGRGRFNSAPARQWQAQIDSLKNWMTNRIEAVAVAGAFNAPPGLTSSDNKIAFASGDSKYIEAFLGAPLKRSVTMSNGQSSVEELKGEFVAQVAPDPTALPGVILDRNGVTCDLTVSPAAPPAAAPNEAQARPTEATVLRPSTAVPQTVAPEGRSHSLRSPWLIGTLTGLIGGWIVVWLARKRSAALRPPSLSGAASAKTAPPPAATVVFMARPVAEARTASATSPLPVMHVEGPARTHTQSGSLSQQGPINEQSGFFALWSQWLKEKLMRRLIAERAELLGTQQAATFKALAVEERLARVEHQIQHQNRAYERRIEELTQELLAAKEENRELIRAQIAQVKAEMEVARVRALAQAKSNPGQ